MDAAETGLGLELAVLRLGKVPWAVHCTVCM